MSMQISDEQVRAIVAKTIIESLSPEVRAQMLERAIVSIITPPKDNYGRSQPSELESCFRLAAFNQIRSIVDDLVQNDEATRTRIREVVTKALSDALAGERLAGAMSDAIIDAMGGRNR